MRGPQLVALALVMAILRPCATAAGVDASAPSTLSPQVPAQATAPVARDGPYRAELDAIGQLNSSGRAAEAIEASRKLLAQVEQVDGPDSLAAAAALHALGSSLLAEGKLNEAETLEAATRALAIRERLLASNHLDIAASLGVMAAIFSARGKNQEALPFARRSYAIQEATLGADHPEMWLATRRLGLCLKNTGDYAAARPLLERALAISMRTFGPEARQVGMDLNNLGGLAWEVGDYEASLAYGKRAVAILEKALGPDAPVLATVLQGNANAEYQLDDFVGAIRSLDRALAVLEKSDRSDKGFMQALVFNTLHLVYSQTGDAAKSRECLERAIALFQTGWPNHPNLGIFLGNLALVQLEHREYKAALATLERAAPIVNASWPGDQDQRAKILFREASIRLVTGDPSRAEQAATEALGIAERGYGPDHILTAEACSSLAEVYAVAGDFGRAAPLFDRTVAIRERALGPAESSVAISLYDVALVRVVMGRPQEAIDAALRSERILRDHLRPTASVLSERELLAYTTTGASTLGLALTVTAQYSGRVAAQNRAVLDSLVRSRGLVLDEVALRHRVASTASDPAVKQLGKDLAAARTQLANLSVRGPADDGPDRYQQLLAQARTNKEIAERAMADRSAVFSLQQAARDIGFDAVTAALADGDALVAFARYMQHDLQRFAPSYARPEPSFAYLAFVLRKGSPAPVPVALGPAGDIDALIARWREAAAGPALTPDSVPTRREAAYRRVATDLRMKIWDPVAPHLAGATRVFIVPDAALHLVNFAALPSGTTQYLADGGARLHYLSTERDVVTARSSGNRQGLLAVGNPAFDGRPPTPAAPTPTPAAAGGQPAEQAYRGPRPTCGGFQAMRFAALPASGKEVREIAALWDQRRGEAGAKAAANTDQRGSALLLTGAAASEAGVKQAAHGRRVLHLATHGFFLGGECGSAFDAVPTPSNASPPRAVTRENPLLLSGLVLAGANDRQSVARDEEDGILTAEEVAALDLDGTEWAVLSACNTGAGEVQAGEGVFGLRRAFQMAGARTVIMSLWPVDDEAARRWMTALYRQHFVEGRTTADAAHGAGLELLRERRRKGLSTHPFYWASFVAAGDWR